MGEFLNMDNILTGDEAASLFTDTSIEESSSDQNNNETTEADASTLFGDQTQSQDENQEGQSESVGSEEESTGTQEDTNTEKDGSSPNNFYSSIANAFKVDGVFPDLDDEEVAKTQTPEDMLDLVKKQIRAGVDDITKRVYDAMTAGVPVSTIKNYENTLSYLDSVTEEAISEESERGEELRRRILQQDFLNKGLSQERAVKMTERLFNSGEDIDEAKQALIENKNFFEGKYQALLNEAKAKEVNEAKAAKKQAEQLRKDLMNNATVFGDLPVEKSIRQKALEVITKPVYKNPDTGEYYTELKKYRMENETEYLKNVALLYALTDGFTKLDNIVKNQSKKEVKRKLSELEKTLTNTSSSNSGRMTYVASAQAESASPFQNFTLDI